MGAHRHRPDARSAAAVGDAERLVQVEVADVGAEPAGLGQTDEGVQVGAVDVHLSAVVVDDLADLTDASSNTPCVDGYVTIDRGQRVARRVGLRLQIAEVDVAVLVAGHDDDAAARPSPRWPRSCRARSTGSGTRVRWSSPRLRW